MQSSENPKDSNNGEASYKVDADETKVPGISNDTTIPTGGIKTSAPNFEQLLKEAEAKAREYYDSWIRAKAETENIRKRSQSDVANAHKYAVESFSSALLDVMDSLDAALAIDNATVESYKNGMELTHKQLHAAFDKFGINIINPKEEKFDPHQHQAMCMVDSDLPPNTVVQVMQKGYKLHDRILRPALVSVSKAAEA